MSGFEMSLRRFDCEIYFNLNGDNAESTKTELMEEGFDLEIWKSFKFEIGISFKPYNKFEADLSFLSAAILTNELDGVCWDPQTGQKLNSQNVGTWATKEIEQQHTATKNQNLIEHPFEGWRKD